MIFLKSLLTEILSSNWKEKIWIHYSDVPFIKIRNKPNHGDPVGIYLFPEEFKAGFSFWEVKKYKFYVELNSDTKILDLGKLTAHEGEKLLKKVISLRNDNEINVDDWIKRMYNAENKVKGTTYYKSISYPFWEFLRNYFIAKPAEWNSILRKLGYDAIFDDTGSIHSMEHQLLVLNPTKIKVLNVEQRKGSGYREVVEVANYIKNVLFKDYDGYWVIQRAKKNRYGMVEIYMKFSNLPENEWLREDYRAVSFNVYADTDHSNVKANPYFVKVYFSSHPQFNYGIGAEYNFFNKNWSSIDQLKDKVDKVFKSKNKDVVDML